MIRPVGHRRFALVLVMAGCSFSVPGTFTPPDGADAPTGDATDAPDGGVDPCRTVELSAMSAHTCARQENGDVWCWGVNGIGEVGRPAQMSCHNAVPCNPRPEKLVMPAATRLGMGEEHMCAIAGAETYCWGRNTRQQFGNGTNIDTMAPTLVTQRANATQIAGGLEHNCSLHAGGVVRCSGNNTNGEVGNNGTLPETMPVQTVPGGVAQLATGYQHACTIQSGFVYCWGADFAGQTSKNIGAPVRSPMIVSGVANAASVAAGYGHTCALKNGAGDVVCWGANGAGQHGVGDMLPHPGAVSPTQFTGAIQLVAGSDHSCARTPAGSMFCWGDGYGPTPVQVPLPRPAVAIAAGSYHDCAALDDGTVWCKGWNAYGQLGTGAAGNQTTLVMSQVQFCP